MIIILIYKIKNNLYMIHKIVIVWHGNNKIVMSIYYEGNKTKQHIE